MAGQASPAQRRDVPRFNALAGVGVFRTTSDVGAFPRYSIAHLLFAIHSGLSLGNIENRLLGLPVARNDWYWGDAARLLGLTRAQLAYRLKRRNDQED